MEFELITTLCLFFVNLKRVYFQLITLFSRQVNEIFVKITVIPLIYCLDIA